MGAQQDGVAEHPTMEGTKVNRVTNAAGMGWAGPIVRTFAQTSLAVLVAAGAGFVDVEIWRTAAVAGGAAVFAYLQTLARG